MTPQQALQHGFFKRSPEDSTGGIVDAFGNTQTVEQAYVASQSDFIQQQQQQQQVPQQQQNVQDATVAVPASFGSLGVDIVAEAKAPITSGNNNNSANTFQQHQQVGNSLLTGLNNDIGNSVLQEQQQSSNFPPAPHNLVPHHQQQQLQQQFQQLNQPPQLRHQLYQPEANSSLSSDFNNCR